MQTPFNESQTPPSIDEKDCQDDFQNNPHLSNCEMSCISGLSADETHYGSNNLSVSQNITTIETMDNDLRRHPCHPRTDENEIKSSCSNLNTISPYRLSSNGIGVRNKHKSLLLPHLPFLSFTKPAPTTLVRKCGETIPLFPSIAASTTPTKSSPPEPSLKLSNVSLDTYPIAQMKVRRKLRKRQKTHYELGYRVGKIFPTLIKGMKKALAKSSKYNIYNLERCRGYFT